MPKDPAKDEKEDSVATIKRRKYSYIKAKIFAYSKGNKRLCIA